MYRRYYRYYDTGQLGPKVPGASQAPSSHGQSKEPPAKKTSPIQQNKAEIITPRKSRTRPANPPSEIQTQDKPKEKSGGLLGSLGLGNLFGGNPLKGLFGEGLMKDGKILGRFHFDDILLGILILILLQDKENEDQLLLLALGYIFIGDGSVKLFNF